MGSADYVWIVKYNQVLDDKIFVCKTKACAHAQAEMIVKDNRHRFDEYPEDKPKDEDLQYSRMSDKELLGWWLEYTETAEDIHVEKLVVLSDAVGYQI